MQRNFSTVVGGQVRTGENSGRSEMRRRQIFCRVGGRPVVTMNDSGGQEKAGGGTRSQDGSCLPTVWNPKVGPEHNRHQGGGPNFCSAAPPGSSPRSCSKVSRWARPRPPRREVFTKQYIPHPILRLPYCDDIDYK